MKHSVAANLETGDPQVDGELPQAEQDAIAAEQAAWLAEQPPSVNPLIPYLANYRYEQEIGGIVFGGVPVRTDDRSKMLLSGIQSKIDVEADPTKVRKIKTSAGFIDIPNSSLQAIYAAVVDHVQKCFDVESLVADDINADIVTTKEQVIAAFDAYYAA